MPTTGSLSFPLSSQISRIEALLCNETIRQGAVPPFAPPTTANWNLLRFRGSAVAFATTRHAWCGCELARLVPDLAWSVPAIRTLKFLRRVPVLERKNGLPWMLVLPRTHHGVERATALGDVHVLGGGCVLHAECVLPLRRGGAGRARASPEPKKAAATPANRSCGKRTARNPAHTGGKT